MRSASNHLTTQKNGFAVQRLTALWAFSESALGGVLHALQAPFTGLIVGGFAVLLISLIAFFSQQFKQIFTSLFIVLIIKAMVSPNTPFPAYIAVSFQALIAVVLFTLLRINFLSILLLSITSLLESALQKILLLTFFFGQSIWKAADSLLGVIATQFNLTTTHGSYWIVSIYLFIHVLAAIAIALFSYKLLKSFSMHIPSADVPDFGMNGDEKLFLVKRKKNDRKLIIFLAVSVCISVVLFVFTANSKQGWTAVLRSLSWTITALAVWYFVAQMFTKFLTTYLHKKTTPRANQVTQIVSLFPVLQQLIVGAWRRSVEYNGIKRVSFFITTVINWSLTSPGFSFTGTPSKK